MPFDCRPPGRHFDDLEQKLRREERWRFDVLYQLQQKLADTPLTDNARLYYRRQRIEISKAHWWAALKRLDGVLHA